MTKDGHLRTISWLDGWSTTGGLRMATGKRQDQGMVGPPDSRFRVLQPCESTSRSAGSVGRPLIRLWEEWYRSSTAGGGSEEQKQRQRREASDRSQIPRLF